MEMYRRTKNTEQVTLEFIDAKHDRFESKIDARFASFEAKIDAKFDRFEEKWERERKESDAKHEALMEKMEARPGQPHTKNFCQTIRFVDNLTHVRILCKSSLSLTNLINGATLCQ